MTHSFARLTMASVLVLASVSLAATADSQPMRTKTLAKSLQRGPDPIYEQPFLAYGSYRTLRLKTYGSGELEARLEVARRSSKDAVDWFPVVPPGKLNKEGWSRFSPPQETGHPPSTGFTSPFSSARNSSAARQYLCDLPLGLARDQATSGSEGGHIRLHVRRSGGWHMLQGGWRGEFIPPPGYGLRAWTYWLPSEPPTLQSTAGLLLILGIVIWIACILAVRAEATAVGLPPRAHWWMHAGWLGPIGALMFFMSHPVPPRAGIGRELSSGSNVRR